MKPEEIKESQDAWDKIPQDMKDAFPFEDFLKILTWMELRWQG